MPSPRHHSFHSRLMVANRFILELQSDHRGLAVRDREEVNGSVIVLQGYPYRFMPNGRDHVESSFGKESGSKPEPLGAVMIPRNNDGRDAKSQHEP